MNLFYEKSYLCLNWLSCLLAVILPPYIQIFFMANLFTEFNNAENGWKHIGFGYVSEMNILVFVT